MEALQPASFFLLRTPLLPLGALVEWGTSNPYAETGGPTSSEEWSRAAAALRTALRHVVLAPDIREALAHASPSLNAAIDTWLADPLGRRGRRVEGALTRYFVRMTSRPTPFGVFAGCSMGQVSTLPTTSLVLQPRSSWTITATLRLSVLRALAGELAGRREPVIGIQYTVNSTLCRGPFESWHFIEPSQSGNGYRVERLQSDRVLECVLDAARQPLTVPELVDVAVREAGNPSATDAAREYVWDMIESGVLVATLDPAVTGDDGLDSLLAACQASPSSATRFEPLLAVRETIRSIANLTPPAELGRRCSRALSQMLPSLPEDARQSPLHLELWKPALRVVLGQDVLGAIGTGVATLMSVGRRRETMALQDFRQRFIERYEQAWVPLLEAIDEDAGIGFGLGGPGGAADESTASMFRRKVVTCLTNQSGADDSVPELVLKPDEWAPRSPSYDEYPATLDAFVTIGSDQSDESGRPLVLIRGVSSPGCRAVARFSRLDLALREQTAQFLAHEQDQSPHALLAEIVFAPRTGAVDALCRPRLRRYEIPLLSRGSAARDDTIDLSDLLVTVAEDGAIVLFSKRLGRRIMPRLTNAHTYWHPLLPAPYRFLCQLQSQGLGAPSLPWDGLLAFPVLPRVRVGSAILSLARWRLPQDAVAGLATATGYDRFSRFQELRAKLKWPRWVSLVDGDNVLATDSTNPLSVDAAVTAMQRSTDDAYLEEAFSVTSGVVRSDEGTFANEIILPMVRSSDVPVTNTRLTDTSTTGLGCPDLLIQRRLPPGDRCFYLKLYASEQALDSFAATDLREITGAMETRTVWFFVRYRDPKPHLRIRFFEADNATTSHVLSTVSRRISSGDLIDAEVATYHREVERYGGPNSIGIAEELFWLDSSAVVSRLPALVSMSAPARWAVATAGAASLIEHCTKDAVSRQCITDRLCSAALKKGGMGASGLVDADQLIRARRPHLDAAGFWRPGTPRLPGSAEDRSAEVAARWERLRELERGGRLARPFESIVASVVHMHINRVLPAVDVKAEIAIARAIGKRAVAVAARQPGSSTDHDRPSS